MITGWRDHAACGRADPRVFFGPDDETPDAMEAREAQAIAVCRPCPVRLSCLGFALSQPAQHGVAGGIGEERRTALRHALVKRTRRRAA